MYPATAPLRAGDAAPASPDGDQAAWRTKVRAFAQAHLEHTAWGVAHAERDHRTTLALARSEGVAVDEDAIYAAAYLHDMGAFPEFATAGVDHGDRSAELLDGVLAAAGFPMAKAPLVRQIIQHHMYYHTPGAAPEALLFRDADTLDFLGAIGVTRILSLATRHRWAPDLASAVETIRRHARELPATLRTASAKREAETRLREMQRFLDVLGSETDELSAL